MTAAAAGGGLFGLKARRTTVGREILAGATTFLTMAYIIAVNPAILGQAGLPVAAVAAATCLAAGLASILMGLVANAPLALAPGMGLNAYMAFTVVIGMHVPWPEALGCVMISGVAFLLLTLVGVRQMIIEAIPPHILAAVAGGIGLFIAFIGLRNAGLVVSSQATAVTLGDLRAPGAILALVGLVIVAGLSVWRVQGAVLIAILITSALGWAIGAVTYKPAPYDLGAIRQTAFALDLKGALGLGGKAGLGVVEILFVFLFVDLFDNIGTLAAVTKRAGLVDAEGRIPGLNRMLIVDSIATMFGALVGTSTVTSYIESAAGVEAGGRTGLTAVVTGVLFLLAFFVAPFAQAIPLSATAPALIVVGALMMAPLREIDWADPLIALPAFLTLVMIPLTFSIANGLAFGITAFAALKLIKGQVKLRRDWMLYALALLLAARFAWIAAT
jgi:AGZA family xanthine/uracil permease-like MFS transporter